MKQALINPKSSVFPDSRDPYDQGGLKIGELFTALIFSAAIVRGETVEESGRIALRGTDKLFEVLGAKR